MIRMLIELLQTAARVGYHVANPQRGTDQLSPEEQKRLDDYMAKSDQEAAQQRGKVLRIFLTALVVIAAVATVLVIAARMN
jgi:aromatic ring hydroxylase